ncbi:hypothetical protein [Flavobacterium selenitireducens]|uniref:hypothetical protein n=1 Tax=Flavobacterium selenitireducens TaxID=2722704 RepID=UPI00168A59A3|nr:hypothetical protein [Flavobacterium selenitireducens]MBD3582150.1 hypothetical protein [Flavobacterium selenitireducens]
MKQILLLCAVLAASMGNAQKNKTLSKDYEYKISEPYRVVDADDKYYISEEGKAIAVKIDKRDIYIQKFDTDKPAQVSMKLYEDAFPKNAVYERIAYIKGRVQLFFTQWDGDNKIEQLFTQEIDLDKGEFVGGKKLILQVQGKVSGQASGRVMDFNLTDKFPIYVSYDHSNFLVKFRRIPEKKRDTKSFDKIGLIAFDGDMNKLSERELTMPYTERQMDNLDYYVDGIGNVYMLNRIFHDDTTDEKKKKDDTTPNYHLELFTLKPGSDSFQVTKVDAKDAFINDLAFFGNGKGDVVVAGFYNNGMNRTGFFSKGSRDGYNYYKNCDGIITYKMKPDGTLYDMFTHEIPLELLNQNESKKTKRKNEKKEEKGEGAKFYDLHLRDLEVKPDGSIVLAAEQYFSVLHTTSGGMNGGMNTYYTYHYNDMLVAKILPNGSLGWMKKIPKQQFGMQGRGSMGFNYFSNDKECFLVFFDNPDNVDITDDKVPATYSDRKKGYLTVVRISDADGSSTRGSILNAKEVEDFKLHQISADRMMKVTDNLLLMEAYKKNKEDVLIKIVLK